VPRVRSSPSRVSNCPPCWGKPRVANNFEDLLGLTPADLRHVEASLRPSHTRLEDAAPEVFSGTEGSIKQGYFDRQQIIELARTDLNFLAALCMPDVVEHRFPPVLCLAFKMVVDGLMTPKQFLRLALGIPRGHAKTTLVKLMIVWALCFSTKKFILIISSIEEHAVNIIRDVIMMLEDSNMVSVFGYWKAAMEVNQNAEKIFTYQGRRVVIKGVGVGGKVRGSNQGHERPDFMIFEDTQTREAADSEVQSKAIEQWMYGTAMKAKSPKGCVFLFVANMYPTPHSILRKLKANKKWIKFICGAILADGTALWPEVHPLSALMDELEHDTEAGKPEIFLAELMNETDIALNSSYDITKFKVFEPNPLVDYPQGRFIVIDPAKGGGTTGDAVGIGYFEIYDGVPVCSITVTERFTPLQAICAAISLCSSTGCSVVGCESNAYQATFLFWFDYICTELGITGIHFVEIYSLHKSKNARVADTIKALEAQEVWLTQATKTPVLKQVVEYNPLKTKNVDEILDMLGFARAMMQDHVVLVKSQEVLEKQEDAIQKVARLEVTSPF
jgi:hypothetical protein